MKPLSLETYNVMREEALRLAKREEELERAIGFLLDAAVIKGDPQFCIFCERADSCPESCPTFEAKQLVRR